MSPGRVVATIEQGELALGNDVIRLRWAVADGRLWWRQVENRLTGELYEWAQTDCLSLLMGQTPLPGARIVRSSEMIVVRAPEVVAAPASLGSPRLGDHFGGRQLVVRLVTPERDLQVEWRALLRDGSNYVRQIVALTAMTAEMELKDVVMFDASVSAAEVAGTVDGSPIVADHTFFAVEHPLATSSVSVADSGQTGLPRCRCSYPYGADLMPGHSLRLTSIVGVVPPGQLRRGFLYYLERERAHPHRVLQHYNNGYEIGCEYWKRRRAEDDDGAAGFRQRQERAWLDAIDTFGTELVEKRGAAVDAFAHDFEWDDETLVWQFHDGYPDGFEPARRAAARYGARIGVWLSPMGGYPGKTARIQSGQKQGFETNQRGLSLAGPRYYARFRAACTEMIRRYGACYFKFDGFGAGNNQPGPGEHSSDEEALLRLLDHLRRLAPDVFINPSTGSWPSPFWLRSADCIWRSGSDSGETGDGSERQQWMTYRDGETYHRVCRRAPLYPLNALMLHGIFVNHAPFAGHPYDPENPTPTYDAQEIISEVRSFFASGTALQEFYINPSLMTSELWDALAEAATWARENADVLVDTHWVGGDPAAGEVYGWASWSARKGVLAFRNPAAKPASITLDLGRAFELPVGAGTTYALRSPWREDHSTPAIVLSAGAVREFRLEPLQVVVYDALPQPGD